IRGAVVYATFIVVIVFIPILTMSGLSGRLFSPLGVAYILAVLASLLVAIIVTPVLCSVFLGDRISRRAAPPLVSWLKAKYLGILLKVEEKPNMVILGVVISITVSLIALPFLNEGLIPELKEGHFIIHAATAPGTSLQESARLGEYIRIELLKIPYVRSVAQQIGRAEMGEDIYGTHYSEFHVDLKQLRREEFELALTEIRKSLAKFPGVHSAVKTFLTERIEETISGYTAPVAVNIYGNDLAVIDSKAWEAAKLMESIPGAADVQVQSPPGTVMLTILLKRDKISAWGLNP